MSRLADEKVHSSWVLESGGAQKCVNPSGDTRDVTGRLILMDDTLGGSLVDKGNSILEKIACLIDLF